MTPDVVGEMRHSGRRAIAGRSKCMPSIASTHLVDPALQPLQQLRRARELHVGVGVQPAAASSIEPAPSWPATACISSVSRASSSQPNA